MLFDQRIVGEANKGSHQTSMDVCGRLCQKIYVWAPFGFLVWDMMHLQSQAERWGKHLSLSSEVPPLRLHLVNRGRKPGGAQFRGILKNLETEAARCKFQNDLETLHGKNAPQKKTYQTHSRIIRSIFWERIHFNACPHASSTREGESREAQDRLVLFGSGEKVCQPCQSRIADLDIWLAHNDQRQPNQLIVGPARCKLAPSPWS